MLWTILKNLKDIVSIVATVADIVSTVVRTIHRERDAAETKEHMKKVKTMVKEGKVKELNKMWGYDEKS